MLNDFAGADKVNIACGYTDLRRGIDGLACIVQQQFESDPFANTLFLFCRRRRDRIKGLYWEIETAKANDLDTYLYLSLVLTNVPILAAKGKDWASELLPSNAPLSCRSLQQND